MTPTCFAWIESGENKEAPVKGQLREIPIIMECSDSDDGEASDDGGNDVLAPNSLISPAQPKLTPQHSPEGAPDRAGAAVVTDSHFHPTDASADADTIKQDGAHSVLQRASESEAVHIEVVQEKDEATITADDALIEAARANGSAHSDGHVGINAPVVHGVHVSRSLDAASGIPQADGKPGVASVGNEDPGGTGGDHTDADSLPGRGANAPGAAAIQDPEAVAEELLEKGRAAFAAGQLQDAKDAFTAAIAAWPLTAAAYSNRAAVSARQGEWSHVVEDSSAVLGLANMELLKFKALCRRAKARAHLGDHLGSLRDYKVHDCTCCRQCAASVIALPGIAVRPSASCYSWIR